MDDAFGLRLKSDNYTIKQGNASFKKCYREDDKGMETIKLDFKNTAGVVKYMNAVNNGPMAPNVRVSKTNFDSYKAAGISYARNHDASFYTGYGGEHTVDVHRIFKNFDADENELGSYIFEPTDGYLKNIVAAGTKIFYRLGASIEHTYKYGTRPPKDTLKWARICEHIIKHYNEGWADGYNMDIEYWEIWNEPDCYNADGSNPCWQGTPEEFIEFYCSVAKYLKETFPKLKIGGPAFMSVWCSREFAENFLKRVRELNVPLDFFSFHWYGNKVENIEETIIDVKSLLKKYGLDDTELILNEWNYIRGWVEEEWEYSIKTEKSLKGASFVSAAMMVSQATGLDMLMYYDARPCTMNGMFHSDTFKPLKPYYTFYMFKELLELGVYVKTDYNKNNIYSCAATNGEKHAIMLTYFNDDDNAVSKQVVLECTSPAQGKKIKVQCYLLDENNDMTLSREEIFTADTFNIYLNMNLFTTYLVKFIVD